MFDLQDPEREREVQHSQKHQDIVVLSWMPEASAPAFSVAAGSGEMIFTKEGHTCLIFH